jgi:hypothetical protein
MDSFLWWIVEVLLHNIYMQSVPLHGFFDHAETAPGIDLATPP